MSEFWLDKIVEDLLKRKEKTYAIGGGISVSGPIHLGNMRSDIITPDALKKLLKEKGKKSKTLVVVYTQDQFKAKPSQMIWFENPEEASKMLGVPKGYIPNEKPVKKYKGMRLIDIPDPFGCCKNWVAHFWTKEFEKLLPNFDVDPKVVFTTDFYKMKKTKEAIKTIFEKKEKVREIVNRYRGENPYPEGWIPFNPWCKKCKSIADTKPIEVDLKKWQISYICEKCGYRGKSSLEDGKLNWRLEWSTLWYVLDLSCEPYGKDHAAAGGSRESCTVICKEIFGKEPPYGFFCEWMGKIRNGKDLGDMTSSGNILHTPKEWLEIASPEVLRFIYIGHKHTKRFAFDFSAINQWIDDYDRAERVYFGKEKEPNKRIKANLVKAYEISSKAKKMPLQISYTHASLLGQLFDPKKDIKKILESLKNTGHVKGKISDKDKEYLKTRITHAKNWAEKYAPNYRIRIQEKPPLEKLSKEQIEVLKILKKELTKKWTEEKLQARIYKIKDELNLPAPKVFQAIYLALLGQNQGPRAGQLILTLGKKRVLKILEKL